MRSTTIVTLATLSLAIGVACGDDDTSTSTSSSATTSSNPSSASSGSGGGGAGCATECAASACNDMEPDATCDACIMATCAAEIGACLGDSGGMCAAGGAGGGPGADCSQCGALLQCGECSDQNDLDAEGRALFNGLLACICGP